MYKLDGRGSLLRFVRILVEKAAIVICRFDLVAKTD